MDLSKFKEVREKLILAHNKRHHSINNGKIKMFEDKENIPDNHPKKPSNMIK